VQHEFPVEGSRKMTGQKPVDESEREFPAKDYKFMVRTIEVGQRLQIFCGVAKTKG